MNNEDKILEMLTKQGEALTKLAEKMDSMDGRLNQLEATQAEQGKALSEIQAELTEVHEVATKVAVTQEAVVLPRLDTLADGHTLLAETLAKKETVETIEMRQDTLEGAVQFLGKRVTALEKAQ